MIACLDHLFITWFSQNNLLIHWFYFDPGHKWFYTHYESDYPCHLHWVKQTQCTRELIDQSHKTDVWMSQSANGHTAGVIPSVTVNQTQQELNLSIRGAFPKSRTSFHTEDQPIRQLISPSNIVILAQPACSHTALLYLVNFRRYGRLLKT